MSFKELLISCTLLLMACQHSVAQTESELLIEQILESVAESDDGHMDYAELSERLNNYLKNPIDINNATPAQLKELVFLNPAQISNLLIHIEENGSLIDLAELQSIDGFNNEVVKRLTPFIAIKKGNSIQGTSLRSLAAKGSNDLMIRYGQLIEKQQGFYTPDQEDKSHYFGSPQRLLLRYRYNYAQHISVSLTMDKDGGEAFFSGAQSSGFDYYSGNIFFKGLGKISKIALGDYALQFGQGLTLWSGLSFGKGAAISTVPKQNIGLKPYSSTNEALYLRGLATTVNFKDFSLTPFVSFRKLDASYSAPENAGDDEQVGYVNQTGFHRTATEIGNKNSLSQTIYGLTIQYAKKRFNAGAIAYQTNFGHAFASGDKPYNQFEFAGKTLINTGVYYDYNWHNIYVFGEVSHSLNSGFAYLNGIIASLSPKLSIVMLQRSYERNYQSFFNQAISESSRPVNEKGFYAGLTINPTSSIEISSYSDFFHFPWLKFGVDAPSRGHEFFSQFTYSYKKKWKAIVRYKFKEKEENDDLDNAINYLEPVVRSNYRAELNYNLTDKYQLRSRVEWVRYKKENKETGFLLYQDLLYNPLVSKFSGNVRAAFFNTPSFNSRIYAYENDVLYSYSIPGFQNRGIRAYINTRYTLTRGLDLWLRYAITKYSNIEKIGTGLDQIDGNTRSDFKIQLRYQF